MWKRLLRLLAAAGTCAAWAPLDARLAAYWDKSDCGPAGDDHNIDWCGGSWVKPDCAPTVAVGTGICGSGQAEFAYIRPPTTVTFRPAGTGGMEMLGVGVDIGNCSYWWYAQYACVPTTTTTSTATTSSSATTSATATSASLATSSTTTTTPALAAAAPEGSRVLWAASALLLTACGLALACCLHRRRPRKTPPDVPACNSHYVIHPSRWCVTMQQVLDFHQHVQQRYPDSDPNVYTVVSELIKPMTSSLHVSYALAVNPQGLVAEHFITHTWAEGMKHFVNSLLPLGLSGGLWICFFANPQSWSPEELDNLLGRNVWLSPFAAALRESSTVIAVRNGQVNMYTRLWCVFELFMAHQLEKPLLVVGPHVELSSDDAVGLAAKCSSGRDTLRLQAAMAECSAEIDGWVHSALRMPSAA